MSKNVCDGKCIDNLEKKYEKALKDQGKDIKGVNLKNKCLLFGTEYPNIALSLVMETEVQEYKNNGEPYKKTKIKNINIIPAYCPICGKALKEDLTNEL